MAISAAPPQESLEAKFRRLAGQWREETKATSSSSEMFSNLAYLQIIGMGSQVVPIVLRALAEEPDHWYVALSAITGDDPVTGEMAGDIEAMAEAWIRWGKQHRIID